VSIEPNDTVRITAGEHAGKIAHFVQFERGPGELATSARVQVRGEDGRWCESFLVRSYEILECPDINVRVEHREHGYGHVRLTGTCGKHVTVADIENRFHDPYFGGRETWIKDGEWGTVVHID
jgi:hypothetical protein